MTPEPSFRSRFLRGETLLTLASAPAFCLVAFILEELHAQIDNVGCPEGALPGFSRWVASSFGMHQGVQFEVMAAAWGSLIVGCVVSISRPVAERRLGFVYWFLGVWLLVMTYSTAFVLAYLLPRSNLCADFGSYPIPSTAARLVLVTEVATLIVIWWRQRRDNGGDRSSAAPKQSDQRGSGADVEAFE